MYRFVNFGKFLDMLQQVRILNLTGSMGTGKTLLSVALGYHFLREGYVKRASYNFPVAFGAAPNPRWSFNVVDEAGTIFDSRMAWKSRELNEKSAALTWRLRKAGSYLVIPSFLDVDRRFRVGIRMWRIWAVRNIAWVYTWEVGPEDSEEQRPGRNYWQGWLLFLFPSHFFNVYDTYFFPGRNLSMAFLEGLLLGIEQRVPDGVKGKVPGV